MNTLHLQLRFHRFFLRRCRGLLPGACVAFSLFVGGCSSRLSDAYVHEYQYLRDIREYSSQCPQFRGNEEYFLAVLVDARHLDYSSPETFFRTMRYGLFFPQEPTIGHAWICVKGKINGKPWLFEGGHSGEFGVIAPKYFDEIFRRALETTDPDPVEYLFSSLPDGCLQKGSGGHKPTLVAAFPLTKEKFLHLYTLLHTYDFNRWSLQDHQCVHFVLACLEAIGAPMTCSQTLPIPQTFVWEGQKIRLYREKGYEKMTFATPEALEKGLFQKILHKEALLASRWYSKTS